MLNRIWRTFKDLIADGYSFIGAIAPILSIGFTAAKALDLNIAIRDVSYAWAILPLLIWLLIAYLRRHAKYGELEEREVTASRKQSLLNELNEHRKLGVEIRNSHPDGGAELQLWFAQSRAWMTVAYDIAGRISPQLRARLETLNETGPAPDRTRQYLTKEHQHETRILSEILRRMEKYIEKNQ